MEKVDLRYDITNSSSPRGLAKKWGQCSPLQDVRGLQVPRPRLLILPTTSTTSLRPNLQSKYLKWLNVPSRRLTVSSFVIEDIILELVLESSKAYSPPTLGQYCMPGILHRKLF